MAWLFYAVSTVARPHAGHSTVFDGWSYYLIEVAAAALVLARGLRRDRERMAWLLLGVGLACYAAGDIGFSPVVSGSADPPFPLLADVGYLGFYPRARR